MTEHIVCPDHPWGENERCCDDIMCSLCGASPSLVVSVSQRDEEVAEALAKAHGGWTADTSDLAWHISIALAAAREGYPR